MKTGLIGLIHDVHKNLRVSSPPLRNVKVVAQVKTSFILSGMKVENETFYCCWHGYVEQPRRKILKTHKLVFFFSDIELPYPVNYACRYTLVIDTGDNFTYWFDPEFGIEEGDTLDVSYIASL